MTEASSETPRLVLLGGAAGAGKTTLAAAWCARRKRAAHIQLDQIRELIVSGFADPQMPGAVQEEQFLLSVEACSGLAKQFLADGFDVAIDDVLHSPAGFEDIWLPHLGETNWRAVIIRPTLEETLMRSAGRTKRVLSSLTRGHYEATSDWPERYRVDTTGLSVQRSLELAESVLQRPDSAVSPAGRLRSTANWRRGRSSRDVWIVTGMPGAGKSTIARLLAKSMPLSAHVPGDLVHGLIVSGLVEPDEKPEGEAERQISLVQKNICLLARLFCEAGVVPVIDWVVRHSQDLTTFLDGLSGLTVRIVVLATAPTALEARNPVAFQRWSHLKDDLLRDLKGIGLWVDSTGMSIEETVDRIRSEEAQAIVDPEFVR